MIFDPCICMWQSRVEIEGYSVAYFDRIVAFEAPYRRTSVKGGAHMHFVDSTRYSCIYAARMSPALSGSSAIRHFEGSDAIEIRDGMTFDFYTGLPHIHTYIYIHGTGMCVCMCSCTSKWVHLQSYHIALNFCRSLISRISQIFNRSQKYFNENF